jgi:putative tryptophan/tyrosine transport system substrate-binding protein
MEVAARALGVQLQSLEISGPNEFNKAFSNITKNRTDAIFVRTSSINSTYEARIVEFAAKSRLPAMYQRPEAVDAGGLMYYGPDDADLFRRAAIYVDKILKGAKPADLPVEQAMRFQLIINLKTAKQIGLTIPPNVLARADRVIR